jgi:hypothetical protein
MVPNKYPLSIVVIFVFVLAGALWYVMALKQGVPPWLNLRQMLISGTFHSSGVILNKMLVRSE